MTQIRKGKQYLHPTWLAEDLKSPMVVEVTAIRQGQVYYRQAGTYSAHGDRPGRMYVAIEKAESTWRLAPRDEGLERMMKDFARSQKEEHGTGRRGSLRRPPA